MLNAVLKEGVKIEGTYEAAMQKVGKQMTSLTRYFNEAELPLASSSSPRCRR